jgi:hypothetical protein
MINKFQLIQSKPSHNNKKQENKETSLMKENLRKQNGIITRANETETKWEMGDWQSHRAPFINLC